VPQYSDDQISFTCAMVEQFLTADQLDLAGVQILEAGLRSGRLSENKPPDAWQQPTRYYPGLTARPWHDPAGFAWVPALEAAFPQIKAEALALFEAGRFDRDPLSADLADGTWHKVDLYTEGRPNLANCQAAPRTTAAVSRVVGATTAGLIYFSYLAPGTHVRPHWGPHNARLRAHLGLVVPEGCSLRVGPETGEWTEGKVIVFDDSYDHEVWNNSAQGRIVLILDIWHPDLTLAQIAAIRFGALRQVRMSYDVAQAWKRDGVIPRLAPPGPAGPAPQPAAAPAAAAPAGA
jgi:hypothetical protein